MKKIILTLTTLAISSLSWAEPMEIPEIIGVQNQNVDIRLSNNNAHLNYDFRIPHQRVFSYNSFSYNEKDTKSLELTTGIVLREPTGYNSRFSLGATLSALNVNKYDANALYMSIFAGIQDSNRRSSTLYYNVSGSISPNIISWGDVSNVYKAKGELGVHLTAGSVIYGGYNYLKVKSDKILDNTLMKYPFIGISINF